MKRLCTANVKIFVCTEELFWFDGHPPYTYLPEAEYFPIGVPIATIKIGNRGESSSTQLPISCLF